MPAPEPRVAAPEGRPAPALPGAPIPVTAYSPRSDLSGSVLSLLGLAARLPPGSFRTEILFREAGPALDLARRRGLSFEVMDGAGGLRRLGRVGRRLARGAVLGRLASHLLRSRPPFLYVNTVGDPAPLQVARWLGIPVLLHFRDSPRYLEGGTRFTDRRRALVLEVPRGFLACSRASRADLVAGGVPPGRVEVIHNGIDVERFTADPSRRRATRSRLGVDSDEILAVLVAGIRPEKGIDTFIRAAALLRDRVPAVRHLVVGGPLGCPFHRDVLEPLARELDVTGRLRFLGPVEDVPAILDAADLVAVPSTDEPFGRVTVEGMSMGKAVVASRTGGIPEVLEHGETGLLCPPGDPKALAEALATLAERPDERRRMGARGRDVAVRRFSEERYAREVAAALARFHAGLEGAAAPGAEEGPP